MDIIAEDGNANNYTFSAYIIEDYNYFKLRNFAAYMNDTVKKFDVKYNATKMPLKFLQRSPMGILLAFQVKKFLDQRKPFQVSKRFL